MLADPWDRSPVGVQRTRRFAAIAACQPARPRLHRRPESWTGASSTPPGVVGHVLGQQAVDDVGGSRQLGYQGVPLIHDHSTMDARRNRGSVRRVEGGQRWDNSTAGAARVGIDGVLLEAMSVHARAAAATGHSRCRSSRCQSLLVNGVSCCFWIFLLGLRLGSFGALARLGWLIGPLTDELPSHDHGGGPQHHSM